ncbi:class I SAM-dependent methyltransferase [Streptomyces africanus]|uniref:class I SAM-dependent methyltransferase n=1 Tax=Streptomyces africanus TaxID=231024 RepID=UPI003CC646FF
MFADSVRAARGGQVVDAGCGRGDVTAQLNRLGVDAFGIDLFPGMIDVARRYRPGPLKAEGSGGHPVRIDVAVWWSGRRPIGSRRGARRAVRR